MSLICQGTLNHLHKIPIYESFGAKVSFFPQMRPEKKQLELTEEEKIIVALLKAENNQALSVLKEKSQLSGKKWDAAMKGLAKHGLTKVVVDGDNKTVVLN